MLGFADLRRKTTTIKKAGQSFFFPPEEILSFLQHMGEEDDDDEEEIHKFHCLKFSSSKVSVYTFAVETRLCNMRDLLKEHHAVN